MPTSPGVGGSGGINSPLSPTFPNSKRLSKAYDEYAVPPSPIRAKGSYDYPTSPTMMMPNRDPRRDTIIHVHVEEAVRADYDSTDENSISVGSTHVVSERYMRALPSMFVPLV